LGYVYKKTCKFDAAVKSYLKVKEISHNLGEKEEEANACFMLGGIFQEMKQHEKAIEFFEKAIIVNKKFGKYRNTNEGNSGIRNIVFNFGSSF
jgi:tetratricopeptide (TPR) repeat protein